MEAEVQDATVESVLLAQIECEVTNGLDAKGRRCGDALLQWLRGRIGDSEAELSVADLVKQAPKTASSSDIASVLLRALHGGILPEADSNPEVSRALIALCESGLPELYGFLRIDPKAQNYVKYEAIKGAHAAVCKILSPISSGFSDIDAAINSRKPILGALNHSVVRAYCAVFDLQDIKAIIEEIFFNLKNVPVAGPSLLADIEACKASIERGTKVAEESKAFLATDFLLPFISSISVALESFVKASKGRFATTLRPGFKAALQKRYPLHEAGRSLQIMVPFVNLGPGLATSVRVTTAAEPEEVVVSNKVIHLGNIPPGDFAAIVDVSLIEAVSSLRLTILLEWGEIGESGERSAAHEVDVLAQVADVDWAAKEYWQPYSSDPAEGENFVGRQEKVKALAAKLLRFPMESFYITGQKRVGKTSLALACIEFAKMHSPGVEIVSSYNLWGSFAHEDPRSSLGALGREIEELLKSSISLLRDRPSIALEGSLSSLAKLCDIAYQASPKHRFVLVIDEFDEIHQELYLQGNLAETFFANLRALSRCKNVSLVLVGGENMPFVMERQGQKLNNFSRINLSYYDREREWADFRLMVEAPTETVLSWHEDAVGAVFNISNGNPYFAKIVCSQALEVAVRTRDTDVTASEIERVTQSHISTLGANSFAHLWQDGIPKPMVEREPDILLRIRVLVALARCFQRGLPPTLSNIFESRGSSDLSELETMTVLRDFVRRDVLAELGGLFSFQLPIFEHWLVDIGANQLAANSLTAELASAAVREEMAAAVRSEEIALLVQSWPAYRGRHIGSDELRAWLQQVPSLKEQRLLFDLLKRLRVFNDARIREMLEQSFSFLQPLPEFVIRKRSDRRRNIVVTYVDGEGKSGPSCASIFAEANMIAGDCIFPPGEFERRIRRHLAAGGVVDAIVIVDDLVGTGRSLSANVERFLQSNSEVIGKSVPVRIISLVATREGQKTLLSGLQKLPHDNIDFRPCEILEERDFAFPEDRAGWMSVDDFDRAKSLCQNIGRRIYKQNPLGFGSMGMLVVFPTNCPNNSLPLLHSPSRAGTEQWKPLFPRVTH